MTLQKGVLTKTGNLDPETDMHRRNMMQRDSGRRQPPPRLGEGHRRESLPSQASEGTNFVDTLILNF